MKHFLAAALVSLQMSTAAFAGDLDLDLSDKDVNFLANLPALLNVQVVTIPPAEYTDAQPTVYLKFETLACAQLNFSLDQLDTKAALLIGVVEMDDLACKGPLKKFKYELQIASDLVNKPIVVVNPTAEDRPVLNMPRPGFCTQEAGRLYNPKTGFCQGYSNGCEKHALKQQGLREPQGGECHHRD